MPEFVGKTIFTVAVLMMNIAAHKTSHADCIPSQSVFHQDVSLQRNVELKDEVTLRDAILALIDRDISARVSIFNEPVPSDYSDTDYAQKLADIQSLRILESAQCMIDVYKPGDLLSKYEVKSESRTEQGLVLKRKGRTLAVAITFLEIT